MRRWPLAPGLRDWTDLLAALDGAGIRYLVVGGVAVGFHGEVRYTKDLDLLLAIDRENVATLVAALREFGVAVPLATEQELLTEDFIFWFGAAPWRIDLLTTIPGVDFEEAYAERVPMPLGDRTATCISRRHLIAAKLASDRTQDFADVENLLRTAP